MIGEAKRGVGGHGGHVAGDTGRTGDGGGGAMLRSRVAVGAFGVVVLGGGLRRLVRGVAGQAGDGRFLKAAGLTEEGRFVPGTPGEVPVGDVGGGAMAVATEVVQRGGGEASGIDDAAGRGVGDVARSGAVAGLTLDTGFAPVNGAIGGERNRAGGVTSKAAQGGAGGVERAIPFASGVLVAGGEAHRLARRVVAEPVFDVVPRVFAADVGDRFFPRTEGPLPGASRRRFFQRLGVPGASVAGGLRRMTGLAGVRSDELRCVLGQRRRGDEQGRQAETGEVRETGLRHANGWGGFRPPVAWPVRPFSLHRRPHVSEVRSLGL